MNERMAEMRQSSKSVHEVTVNGRRRESVVPPNMLLIDYLREELRLTGTKTGCDGGECGACTVLVDGKPMLSCITLVSKVNGKEVETVESLSENCRLSSLQRMFHEKLGTQCGFCTPGMIMASEALLRNNTNPSDEEIRKALEGNLCRCTGYVKILESVKAVAETGAAK